MGVTNQLLTGMILQDTQLKKMSQNWELNPQGMKPPLIRYGKSLSPPKKTVTVCSIQPMQKRRRTRRCVWCAYFEHDPDCQISKKKHMITCIYTCVCLCTKFMHISIHLVLSKHTHICPCAARILRRGYVHTEVFRMGVALLSNLKIHLFNWK